MNWLLGMIVGAVIWLLGVFLPVAIFMADYGAERMSAAHQLLVLVFLIIMTPVAGSVGGRVIGDWLKGGKDNG